VSTQPSKHCNDNQYLSRSNKKLAVHILLSCYCLQLIVSFFFKINSNEFLIHPSLFQLSDYLLWLWIPCSGVHLFLCFLMGASIKIWHAHFPFGGLAVLLHATWQLHGIWKKPAFGVRHESYTCTYDQIEFNSSFIQAKQKDIEEPKPFRRTIVLVSCHDLTRIHSTCRMTHLTL
jgi:hypothetical protein